MTNAVPSLDVDPALLVHAYVDNELDPVNALALARQIDADPALAAEVARTQSLHNALRKRLPPRPLPPELRSRIDAAVGLQSRSNQWRASHPTWRALAASVVLALALGSGSTWLALQAPPSDRIADAVVASHIRALMAPQPADLNSSERHTVKPWFSTRLPVSPRVIDLSPEGFPLIGGRIDVINATPLPTVVYGRRKHLISVIAMPDAKVSRTPPLSQTVHGYNLIIWRQDNVTYWAISDLNAKELQEFAQKFQDAP